MSFIPMTIAEAHQRGWTELDVIFVTGDAYIDHPSFGVPLLARWLEAHGFRVGILAQPDWRSVEPFKALGRPRLFFAVSAGAMDSMVAHYTPARKLRHDDAYTPGNKHGGRPNRAVLVYTSRLKQAYKDVPVVIGGIEASLRRFSHYDYWDDSVRRSVLFDAKADLLIYGMGERPLLELARRMAGGEPAGEIRDIRGTGYATASVPAGTVELPAHERVASDTQEFSRAYTLIAGEQNPFNGKPVTQKQDGRWFVCMPPTLPLTEAEMDELYGLPFEREPHPSYHDPIPAWEQIRTSVTVHRGCFGGCAFCAITHHQGRFIQSRSARSIADEIAKLATKRWFRGSISDMGGPTANMYGCSCGDEKSRSLCRRPSCIFPQVCRNLRLEDRRAADLLKSARKIPGVRHVAVSSGIRHDLLERQPAYRRELITHHVGGLLKVAPEHLVDRVTDLMRKPGRKMFESFLRMFREESRPTGKDQHIVPYLISGHPGCRLDDMADLVLAVRQLGLHVEQVQDFTPTPGSLSTCMYYTGTDPFSGKPVHVARTDREKAVQKAMLLWHIPEERKKAVNGLRILGREDLIRKLQSHPHHGRAKQTR